MQTIHPTSPLIAQLPPALILRTRLSPARRRLLGHMGVRIKPISWSGFVGPDVDRVDGPPDNAFPDWLDPAGADDLINVLQEMETAIGTPPWVKQMLVSYRAGELLQGDGSIDLDDGPDPRRLVGELLRLPDVSG